MNVNKDIHWHTAIGDVNSQNHNVKDQVNLMVVASDSKLLP